MVMAVLFGCALSLVGCGGGGDPNAATSSEVNGVLTGALTPRSGLPQAVTGKIVFVSEDQLFVVKPDGTGLRRLTDWQSEQYDPAWSPNGAKVAFGRRDAGSYEDGNTWVMNSDGTGLTQVTATSGCQDGPSWVPDGTRLIFSTYFGSNYNADICSVSANGGPLTRITRTSADEESPDCSPDGTRIAYLKGGALWVMNADGTGGRKLTQVSEARLGQPHWCPDGQKIVFAAYSIWDDKGEIYVINADGTNRKRLTRNAVTDGYPNWSPDGVKIIFSRNEPGDLWTMNADGTGAARLKRHAGYDWGPDWWAPG